ncbi:hypothetical protein [Bradyrhizobium sp. LVM 105]|uniref:hypothetical protein n=1 Tax=Bradyrhizobium sp. LVM 105 TaxID=2341115 RepID=UPI000F80A388|nr:hypothetical protein [Bradyrhizobium sp. LVM 105]RTE88970.1 hypothetical protein D6B98_33050 [Bradyrhizobium sp. LVM 105]
MALSASKPTVLPPRHNELKDFRILVIDTHPPMPTGDDVRSAIGRAARTNGRTGRAREHVTD